jgi:capsular polysaccharide biosynthesis protein
VADASEPVDLLDLLGTAAADLEAGRDRPVIDALGAVPDSGGPVGRALLRVALGREAEASGQHDEAVRLMEQAFGSSPALPAAALRALAEFFGRRGQRRLGHHAFLMLQIVQPETVDVVLKRLPRDDRAHYAVWASRRSLELRRYLTYVQAPFKRALRECLGAWAAAHQLASVRSPYHPRILVSRRLEPLVDHAREAGLDYEELIPAGPAPPTPVRFLGAGAPEPEARRTRALFACVLEDVVVTARSSILLTGDHALMDVQEDELTSAPHDLADDPLVLHDEDYESILLEPAERGSLRRVPEAIWMTGVHTSAFGHWLIEYLPKVWALMARDGYSAVPLLVDARLAPQHLEAVRLLAGDANPFIVLEGHESVRVDRLWVASALGYLASGMDHRRLGVDDEAYGRLMARVAPTLEAIDTTGTPTRLYLSRKPSQHRRLVNAREVEDRLAAAGFVRKDFAELPFIEQLRLVRGADWIVGPSGSALLMAIFGHPRVRIGALVPLGLFDVAWIGQACRRLDVDLTAIVGDIVQPHPRYPWLSDYRIDLDVLDDYLQERQAPVAVDVRASDAAADRAGAPW